VITAAELLGEIDDCRARYPTRDALAGDAGQAAVAKESGKRKTATFRWAATSSCAKRSTPWPTPPATTTPARYAPSAAPSRVLWRCWQDRVPYDPERHRALQRHITVTIPPPPGPVPDLAATQRMEAPLSPGRRPRQGRARSA
jgi:transposase